MLVDVTPAFRRAVNCNNFNRLIINNITVDLQGITVIW